MARPEAARANDRQLTFATNDKKTRKPETVAAIHFHN
jgi:hypothetical protein